MKLLFPIRKWSIHLKIIDDKIIVKAQVSIPCKFCYQWQGFFLITDILLIHLDNYNYFLSPNLLNHYKLYILTYYQLFKMISTYLFRGVRGAFQRCTPRFNMNHIKDMIEENKRAKMQEIESTPMIQTSNRVYKPSHTIQFNREGEVLLYSANPCTSETVYFKYPYILYESFIPLAILNYILNPFDMVWYWGSYSLYGSLALTIPRIWYFSDFKWMPMRLYLLRGGRVLKVEAQNLGADRFVYWLQNFLVKPLTQDKMHFDDQNQADFLTEQGQLKYDLNVEVDEFKFFGVNVNDQQLQFKTYGTVHQPQLFEAALKGYNIDTTDFVINTADNVRYREPNHNL